MMSRPILASLSPGAYLTLRRPRALSPRSFSTTSWVNTTLPPKPGRFEEQTSLEGKPIPDTAKEDESKLSGVRGEDVSSSLSRRDTPNLFSLKGQTVIVTGGGRGLGQTISQAILESGANVATLDLLPEPSAPLWESSRAYAKKHGLSITYNHLDVTSQESVSTVFQKIFDEAPSDAPVRGLFCSAGIQLLKSAVDLSPQEFRKIIDVNLTGSFLSAQAFAREYIKRNLTSPDNGRRGSDGHGEKVLGAGGGSIVLTGSMSGHIANFGLECAAYNPSKAAVNQLAKNLAMEWGTKGIRVNSLSPGYIRTAMTKALLDQRPDLNEIWLRGSLLGRLSTPDEFRGPVVFLLSDASSFVTGADLLVDGGHTAT